MLGSGAGNDAPIGVDADCADPITRELTSRPIRREVLVRRVGAVPTWPQPQCVAAMLRVGSIVVRVDELDRRATFRAAAVDRVPRERGDPGIVVLRPREGAGSNVCLDVARSERTIPPRLHLDLYTDEQDAEVARLVAPGAREVAWAAMPADADFRILDDPAGNRFCVVETSR